jgi:hypothetical protein
MIKKAERKKGIKVRQKDRERERERKIEGQRGRGGPRIDKKTEKEKQTKR